MEQDINKAIDNFSKGNKDLAKILALFACQMGAILGKEFTNTTADKSKELLKINEGLINYYDIHV